MNKLMTFESFVENSEDFSGGNSAKEYFVYMFDTTPENISGEVRDADGKCIYTVDLKTLDSGAMQTPTDMSGLRKHLVETKKLKDIDTLEPGQSASPQTSTELTY